MSVKIALVTGGIGGLGTEICKDLASHGRKVVACYLPSEEEQAKEWQKGRSDEGLDIDIVAADVTSFEDTSRMIQKVESEYGPVDILVNCAGITRDKTLRNMDPDHWEQVINANLNSIFNVTRQVIEGMVGRGFGRIVNISSVNGQKGQFGQTNYSASKAGVHGFTMALAQEVAARGVTVNTVSPGYVATPMTMVMPDDIREKIVSQVPVGRIGEPRDVAWAIKFLTDDQSDYITGVNLPVNGGLYMSF